MDRVQLQRRIRELRQYMFNEGYLGEYFLVVEGLENHQPDFVENFINTYFPSSSQFMKELDDTLEKKPLKLSEVERLIQKLKGGSAHMGATKVCAAVDRMWNVYKSGNIDGLSAAYEGVKTEHAALRRHLEPYAELLGQLRGDDCAPQADESSDSQEDTASTGSNNVNDG